MAQLRKVRYPGYYDATMSDETLDNELATSTSDGLMSKEDKIKLDKLVEGSNPSGPVKAEDVVESDDKKFVSEEQIAKWDSASHAIDYDEDRQAIVIKIFSE